MVIATLDGVAILALPTDPAPRQIQIGMNDIVAAPTNPFTGGVVQVQQWPGGDFWSGQIALPKLKSLAGKLGQSSQLATWNAFLAECRGRLNTFLLSDSSYTGPAGSAKGLPVVDRAQQPMVYTLNTRGWTAGQYRALMVGDYFSVYIPGATSAAGASVGTRLHRITSTLNSDSNGKGQLQFWPSLREPLADGAQIILKNPAGLFRMAKNQRTMTVDETHLGATSFDVVEAT